MSAMSNTRATTIAIKYDLTMIIAMTKAMVTITMMIAMTIGMWISKHVAYTPSLFSQQIRQEGRPSIHYIT